jgi:AcrR family transcriptional regulator
MSRPRPERRSEQSRRAILLAALELCREETFDKATVEAIAKRAGVGKQTIYRWWASKAAVVQEAINERIGTTLDFPDTGDIVADLHAQLTAGARFLRSPDAIPFTGLIGAAQSDPVVAQALLDMRIRPRANACRKRLETARQQGQVRDDVDLDDVIELLYGAQYYRLLLHNRPITLDQVDRILDLAFNGVRPSQQGPRNGEDGDRPAEA